MNKNVYCYHERISAMGEQNPMIELWAKTWRANGWNPVVLDRSHAQQHPRFKEFNELVSSFPSINPKQYEVACWLRWLAFAAAGGGMHSDYDVMNRSLTPDMAHKLSLHCPPEMSVMIEQPVVIHDLTKVPCLVQATDTGAAKIVDAIMSGPHQHDGAHYSDMYFFKASPWPHRAHSCLEYGYGEWATAPAVHFSHGSCHIHGKGKHRIDIIRQTFA